MRPVIRVLAGGSPVNGIFYSRLISCGIRDESGQESDTLECTFDWRGYAIALPNEGAILEPLFGYPAARSPRWANSWSTATRLPADRTGCC